MILYTGANPVEELRLELGESGVDVAMLDGQILRKMLERVTMTEMFAISIAEIKAGRALIAGWNNPITGL